MAYRREIADHILAEMAKGRTVRTICREGRAANPRFPAQPSVFDWVINDHDGFAARYERAREIQCRILADEVMEVADDQTIEPQSRRIMVDTRKWLLSKVLPKIYGERVALTGDSASPLVVQIVKLGDTDGPTDGKGA